jgi:phosphoribosylformimino-5-aminoimidazole carboxamide ribotide isomerase
VIVVPAVDVRLGRVVRLRQGQVGDEMVYGDDPVLAARRWEAEGAQRIHVVDLDAAIDGKPQSEAIGAVIDALRIPVEVGGGLRSVGDARRYLDERGADRVIFGTAAVAHAEVVQEAVARWPEAVAVAIDARGGRTAVAGWSKTTAVDALELANEVEGWGVSRVQYTDIARDGTLVGPNLAAIARLGRSSGLRITAAGGISTLDDLRRLAGLALPGLDEVIVGRALYDGHFTLAEAMAALAGPEGEERG